MKKALKFRIFSCLLVFCAWLILIARKNLRDINLAVARRGDADAGRVELAVENVTTMLRRIHPAADGQRVDIVVTFTEKEIFPDFAPAVYAGLAGAVDNRSAVAVEMAEKRFARHLSRKSARHAGQFVVPEQIAHPFPAALVVDQTVNLQLAA